ncbi:hypothetical protein EBZ35_02505 [bacterium]|nr:hypothetical protein [bacterium]
MVTFFDMGLEKRLVKDNQLMKNNRLINWQRLRGSLKKVKRTRSLGVELGTTSCRCLRRHDLGNGII